MSVTSGPLGVSKCSDTILQEWYVTAQALDKDASSTAVGPVLSGGIGVRYMHRQLTRCSSLPLYVCLSFSLLLFLAVPLFPSSLLL